MRSAEGREIRHCFIPRAEDTVLLSADYSQIELRLLAHFAADESCWHSGVTSDVHQRTAAEIFHVPPDEVTSEYGHGLKQSTSGLFMGSADSAWRRGSVSPAKKRKRSSMLISPSIKG